VGNLVSGLVLFAQSAREGIDNLFVPEDDLEGRIGSVSINLVLYSAVGLIVLTVIASFIKDRQKKFKLPIFIAMATIMIGSISFLGAATIYLNASSDSGGPVHWHADFEIWACGNELELKNPYKFLSNKVGTSTLHEHNDRRVHLEGVVVDETNDASLGKFFHVIDGTVTGSALVVPLNDEGGIYEDETDGDGPSDLNASQLERFMLNTNDGRFARFINGQTCGDAPSEVQVYVYKYDEETDTYAQQKLAEPQNYTIAREPNVPPGDCIIVEFGPVNDQTDKLCEQYGIRDVDRCEQFGVLPHERSICQARQLNYPLTDPNSNLVEPSEEL